MATNWSGSSPSQTCWGCSISCWRTESPQRAQPLDAVLSRALMQRLLDGIVIHLLTADHLHGLPVVGEFSAAIQTDYVGSGDAGSLGAPVFARYGETVVLVPTAEEHIYQTRHHYHTPEGPNCEWFCPELSTPAT